MLTPYEKWHFDLMGYIVLPQLVEPAEVAHMAALADHWHELPEAQLPAPLHTYDAANYEPGKIRGICHPPYVDEVYQRVVMHPQIMRWILALTDNCPQMLLSSVQVYPKGSGDFALHSGFAGGIRNPANDYQAADGRIFATFINVGVALSDWGEGDGFCCIPGSHKANFPWPEDVTVRTGSPLIANPSVKAGDVLIFTELLRHGALAWQREDPRRVLFTRYSTSYASWSVGSAPIPEHRDKLPDDLADLMEPAGFQTRKAVVDKLLSQM